MRSFLRVAFVHDWLDTYRGGEKVLESLLTLYPDAPIFTLFYDPKKLPESITSRKVVCPQGMNRFRKVRKALLPLFPAAAESFPLWDYDLVISSSSCVAKGVIPAPHAKHLCYIHSPMRYIWDQKDEYLGGVLKVPVLNLVVGQILKNLRIWDANSSVRVDKFIANSSFVRSRVKRYYGHEASVIHPPIDLERFQQDKVNSSNGGYYVACGAFVGYKRFDLAIKACEAEGKKLIVAGSGPMEQKLRSLAGVNTVFEIAPNEERWVELLQNAEALLFPGIEDFGMIPIEAMASGTPVLAFNKGGAVDYIKPGVNGEFFEAQDVDSLRKAIQNFDSSKYSREDIRQFTDQFSHDSFLGQIKAEIDKLIGE